MNDEPQRRRTSGGGRHTAGRAPRARQKIALTPARVAQGCVALALGGVLTGLTVHGAAAAQSQRAQMLDARTAVTDAALDAVAVAHAASKAAAGVTVDDGRVAQLEAATAELEKLLDETGVDALRAAGTVSRSAGRAGDDRAEDASLGDRGSRAADPVAAGTGEAGEGGASAPTNEATDGAADAAPTGPSADSSAGSTTAPSAASPSTETDGLLSASERPLVVPPASSAAASTPAPPTTPTSAPPTAPSAPTTAPTTVPTTGSADRAGTTRTAGPTGDATGTPEATAGSSDAARTTPDATTTATTPTATTPVAPDATMAPGATPGSSDQVAQDAVVVPPVEGPEDAATRRIREALARVVELRDAVLETTEDKQAERAAAADAAQQKSAEVRAAAAAAEQAKADEAAAQARAAADAQAQEAAERAAWKKSLLGYANGRIPASALCAPTFDADALLRCDAAQDLDALDAAYYADFGVHVTITDSYRSYASQVTCRATKGWLCATPGTSNHGTGIATDLGGGIQTFGTKQHRWMKAHAAQYGWAHPGWAEPGSSKPEPWHWEYTR